MRTTIAWLVIGVVGCQPQETRPVTGSPEQDATSDYEQAEAVATISYVEPTVDLLVVTYNDRTEPDLGDPKVLYPSGINGATRIIKRGMSLMGYSHSDDEGGHFAYGGKVLPPPGWSVLWGDPAITTVGGTEGTTVYLANLGVSDASFPAGGELTCYKGISCAVSVIDGFCVARSFNSGYAFQDIGCFKKGQCSNTGGSCTSDTQCISFGPDGPSFGVCNGDFYDGSALVAGAGSVYFAATDGDLHQQHVWRADSSGVAFSLLEDYSPFDGAAMVDHPRLQISGNRLYIVGMRLDGRPMASFLELAADGPQQWSPPRVIGNVGVVGFEVNLADRKVRQANQFSFGIGPAQDGETAELRLLYTRINAASGRFELETVVCDPNLPPHPQDPQFADCGVVTGWSRPNLPFDEFSPLLTVAGNPPAWKAVWLSRQPDPSGVQIQARHGNLAELPGGARVFISQPLVPAQTPCSAGDPGDANDSEYWGDYNDLVSLGTLADALGPNPRFFSPFTDNLTGCDFRGYWTADMHVGGVVFQ